MVITYLNIVYQRILYLSIKKYMKIGCFRIFAKKETVKPEFVDLITRYKYNCFLSHYL